MHKQKNTFVVSVIVPTYNRSKLLSYTLTSLVKQKSEKDFFEVIVVDDGSSDDTKVITEGFMEALNLQYIFQEDKGYCVASARNIGIRAATGKICVFIDSGVIVDENCVTTHANFHKEKGELAAAIGYVYGFEENDHLTNCLSQVINVESPTESIRKLAGMEMYDVREQHYQFYSDNISDLPAPWLWFWTCHVSVSRHNLIKINYFDEAYDQRWGVEDNDLGFRLNQAGIKISLLRQATSVHYPHTKNKEERHKQGYQNCINFHKKFGTPETKVFLEHFMDSEFVDINLFCNPLPDITTNKHCSGDVDTIAID